MDLPSLESKKKNEGSVVTFLCNDQSSKVLIASRQLSLAITRSIQSTLIRVDDKLCIVQMTGINVCYLNHSVYVLSSMWLLSDSQFVSL